MKALKMMLAMMMVVLTASIAVAEDDIRINIDNRNTVNATGGNASSNQTQTQNQQQQQKQFGEVNIETPVGIPIGVAPLISSGTSVPPTDIRTENCRIMSYEDASGFSVVLDSSQLKHVVKSDFSEQNGIKIVLSAPTNGTLVGSGVATGKEGDLLLALISLASKDSMENGGNVLVIKRILERTGTLTNGTSTSWGAGLGASILNVVSLGFYGSITKGSSVVSSNGVYVLEADYYRVEGMTLACGGPTLSTKVSVALQPPAACNPNDIFLKIKELLVEVQKCTRYCYNNLMLRNALGDANIDLSVCTGDKKYFKEAMYHYQVAERNFRNGHDISAHKAEAGQVIAQVYYNWAGCIYELQGREQAMRFAKAKRLERIPTGFTR